ncbi:hypothetical protein BC938DRAFT_473350 [Jimgerdemannia flammicorona]|uniref:N-acetyltransferase domain-containing protein n=1 Tax=Jimgerdemannia flammicorona TaxID=994334 RepID=A0A433QTD2_9FUNG|nr:hypothetical protein BC938DRAFT_473350 [Jimgerdemannia flammicorona]
MTSSLEFHTIPHSETASLVPLLRDADEDELTIRRHLSDPTTTTYAVRLASSDEAIAALTMRWSATESELIYLSVDPARRGCGYGKRVMSRLVEMAHNALLLVRAIRVWII